MTFADLVPLAGIISAGGTGERQLVRMVRPVATRRSGFAAGPGHGRAKSVPHPAAPRVPRQLSVCAALHEGCGAAHREGLRHGRGCHLYGIINATRMGECVHGGGSAHAVLGQPGQGPRTDREEREDGHEGIFKVRFGFNFFFFFGPRPFQRLCSVCLPAVALWQSRNRLFGDVTLISNGPAFVCRRIAEAAFKNLVKTHEKYGWVTPSLSDG